MVSMDTPIKLIVGVDQLAFDSPIDNDRLKEVCIVQHRVVLFAVKQILGTNFLLTKHRYRVNSDICSGFLASALVAGAHKNHAEEIFIRLFDQNYLGNLHGTLVGIDSDLCIAFPWDLPTIMVAGSAIPGFGSSLCCNFYGGPMRHFFILWGWE